MIAGHLALVDKLYCSLCRVKIIIMHSVMHKNSYTYGTSQLQFPYMKHAHIHKPQIYCMKISVGYTHQPHKFKFTSTTSTAS